MSETSYVEVQAVQAVQAGHISSYQFPSFVLIQGGRVPGADIVFNFHQSAHEDRQQPRPKK